MTGVAVGAMVGTGNGVGLEMIGEGDAVGLGFAGVAVMGAGVAVRLTVGRAGGLGVAVGSSATVGAGAGVRVTIGLGSEGLAAGVGVCSDGPGEMGGVGTEVPVGSGCGFGTASSPEEVIANSERLGERASYVTSLLSWPTTLVRSGVQICENRSRTISPASWPFV